MKKVAIFVLFVFVICFCLTGCQIGNRNIGIDTTQTFRWAIIQLGNGELIEGPVDYWRDFDESNAVQITVNGVTYLTHYAHAILATEKP